ANDPVQFASQMVGRLLPHQGLPTVKQFLAGLIEGAPELWLRPLHPALHSPGTSLVRTLEGHSDQVSALAVSADGRHAVSASYDQTFKVWNLDAGRELRTLKNLKPALRRVAVTAEGRRAVSASDDRTLEVWDLESGRKLHTLEGHLESISGVAVTQ